MTDIKKDEYEVVYTDFFDEPKEPITFKQFSIIVGIVAILFWGLVGFLVWNVGKFLYKLIN